MNQLTAANRHLSYLCRANQVAARPHEWRSLVRDGVLPREIDLNFILRLALISFSLTAPAIAQKLVDPTTVAPEYREAAEKRRAEQIKQRECAHKADVEKVVPRDRTDYLKHCLESDAGK